VFDLIEEVFDRIATGDNKFNIQYHTDGRISLIPAPDEVIHPGTPINKDLLQPILDALKVVDISTDYFESLTSIGGDLSCTVLKIQKTAHFISGAVMFTPSENNATGISGGQFVFDINKKYAPSTTTNTLVICTAADGSNYELGFAVIIGTRMYVYLPTISFVGGQMSFSYVCKGE
jgi:hypothetical protein